MSTRHAYAVGTLDKASGQLISVGIYSEPTPTMSFAYFPFTILEIERKTYSEASDQIKSLLSAPEYAWAQKFMRREETPGKPFAIYFKIRDFAGVGHAVKVVWDHSAEQAKIQLRRDWNEDAGSIVEITRVEEGEE